MSRTRNSGNEDYDKKFIEDLETAQALSLESLALEQFKLEKEKANLLHKNEGSLSFPKIRPPPPTVLRRNSTTQPNVTNTISGQDLISFQSPTASKHPRKNIGLYVESNSSSININYRKEANYKFEAGFSGNSKLSSISSTERNWKAHGVVHESLIHSHSDSKLNKTKNEGKLVQNVHFIGSKQFSNLIDLNEPKTSIGKENVRVSLLEAFDPLLTRTEDSLQDINQDCCDTSQQSIYDPYDPFDYFYSPPSRGSHCSDLVYSAVIKAPETASVGSPVLPCQVGQFSNENQKKQLHSLLHENVTPISDVFESLQDPDLRHFIALVKQIRGEYKSSDSLSNIGLIMGSSIKSYYEYGTCVKVIIYPPIPEECITEEPIAFTCDVSSTFESIVSHAINQFELPVDRSYILKIKGQEEYFNLSSTIKDSEYVHNCLKLEKDVVFSLINIKELHYPLARTVEDDLRSSSISVENILPNEFIQPISYDTIIILLETVEKEIKKVLTTCQEIERNNLKGSIGIKSQSVFQAVKAVCSLLGNVETLQVTNALEGFCKACNNLIDKDNDYSTLEVLDDEGDYSVVKIAQNTLTKISDIEVHCDQIRLAIQNLIEMYIRIFRVGFQINTISKNPSGSWFSSEIIDNLIVYIDAIHCLPQKWCHTQYLVGAQVYYGTRPIGQPVLSNAITPSDKIYQRILFDSWLNFEGTTINILSRECRIVFELYGRSLVDGQMQLEELGWAAIQLFDYDGCFTQGSFLLSMWPPEANKKLGPAPPFGTHPLSNFFPMIGVIMPDLGGEITFPSMKPEVDSASWGSYDFLSLDDNTQHQLLEIMNQDTFSNPVVEDREILWEKRHYLLKHPKALPKVLLAAHSWDYTCLPDLYSMVYSWAPMDPVSAFQLLLPCFPDYEVRLIAVGWIDKLSTDRLIDYLPQLVQALKNETYETSPLADLLLRRSLSSPRFAHCLYWLLIQMLPGESPQNSTSAVCDVELSVSETRYHRRMQLILRALLAISGESLRNRFMSQQLLIKGLSEAADLVKTVKESMRLNALWNHLEGIHYTLSMTPTCLPINPGLIVDGINIKQCSYFPSNTLPLKIYFTNKEGMNIPAIFKVGDDLQQDMMTLQMIRLMDKMWLKEGLDLKIVTFTCIPTGFKKGIIEMIPNSETLRKIQVEFGLTGSFKDRPIAEWLAKHNPSTFEYERAVSNFTASCAGYCVATYLLGICDRHNDNIMLKTTGHIFHIDFGKFLGDAQMIGNFKRDRTPFVLTSDMAYVINGGEKPSVRFHYFVDLCCQAFNIVRKYGNVILNLFGLMASSGVGGLTVESVRYVQNALLPHLSDAEAAATFARMIQSALKSWFTQFNFFLHNLAQLRFSIDEENDQLLSFVSKTYSLQQEGRITQVEVYGCQKRYDPEKYYLYILQVYRVNQTDPTFIFRSFKEFCELHQKLCILFPLAKCHSLQNTGLQMGRSNIKQVAEKRMADVRKFLDSLFCMADEICHSDLVYTFFHPLLRDQQDSSVNEVKLKDKRKERMVQWSSHVIKGEIKLSIQYLRETFRVMVHHVRDLPCLAGYQEPSTYVKVYLLPDPSKATKRKTKVIRKSCHPSFMEMLEYRMPLERVQSRLLQATVWSHDPLQENEFLGGTTINLCEFSMDKEVTCWYPLQNIHR